MVGAAPLGSEARPSHDVSLLPGEPESFSDSSTSSWPTRRLRQRQARSNYQNLTRQVQELQERLSALEAPHAQLLGRVNKMETRIELIETYFDPTLVQSVKCIVQHELREMLRGTSFNLTFGRLAGLSGDAGDSVLLTDQKKTEVGESVILDLAQSPATSAPPGLSKPGSSPGDVTCLGLSPDVAGSSLVASPPLTPPLLEESMSDSPCSQVMPVIAAGTSTTGGRVSPVDYDNSVLDDEITVFESDEACSESVLPQLAPSGDKDALTKALDALIRQLFAVLEYPFDGPFDGPDTLFSIEAEYWSVAHKRHVVSFLTSADLDRWMNKWIGEPHTCSPLHAGVRSALSAVRNALPGCCLVGHDRQLCEAIDSVCDGIEKEKGTYVEEYSTQSWSIATQSGQSRPDFFVI